MILFSWGAHHLYIYIPGSKFWYYHLKPFCISRSCLFSAEPRTNDPSHYLLRPPSEHTPWILSKRFLGHLKCMKRSLFQFFRVMIGRQIGTCWRKTLLKPKQVSKQKTISRELHHTNLPLPPWFVHHFFKSWV